jgi:hypothetical protein
LNEGRELHGGRETVEEPYTCAMAEEHTPEQLMERYMSTMGKDLGEAFHHLMQEVARLHLKWNEFNTLCLSPERIRSLNRAAPGFFWMVQSAWWNDILLHICRMTDRGTDKLSVRHISKLISVLPVREATERLLDTLVEATMSVRDLRDRYIAHRNIDVALDRAVKPLADPDRDAVLSAIKALDDLLHFVDNHFTKSGPITYEHLDILGGANSILDIVERGLRDRDRQYEFIPDWPYRSFPE